MEDVLVLSAVVKYLLEVEVDVAVFSAHLRRELIDFLGVLLGDLGAHLWGIVGF